ncbi:MAG: FAD-dependent oxidoreductase [Rhodoglobus sp.]
MTDLQFPPAQRHARITVVGAGVIGLSIAHDLAVAGHDVTVVADVDTLDTVSALAAALWFPYRSEVSPAATAMLERSLARFTALSTNSATGVLLREGVVVERAEEPDRSWAAMAPDATSVYLTLLPGGVPAEPRIFTGMRATLPLIVTPKYLAWLKAQVRRLGVTFESRTIASVDDVDADLVIVAAGLRGGELLGDDSSVYPVRGQVVRMSNPGLTEWITDVDDPSRTTYVFPREDDVVVGGVSTAGDWNLEIDPADEEGILARAFALVPELKGQEILSRAVGLRPARPTIRLEHVDGHAVPVIAAYGHGGAGVTLSWGTAERVALLVDEALAR